MKIRTGKKRRMAAVKRSSKGWLKTTTRRQRFMTQKDVGGDEKIKVKAAEVAK